MSANVSINGNPAVDIALEANKGPSGPALAGAPGIVPGPSYIPPMPKPGGRLGGPGMSPYPAQPQPAPQTLPPIPRPVRTEAPSPDVQAVLMEVYNQQHQQEIQRGDVPPMPSPMSVEPSADDDAPGSGPPGLPGLSGSKNGH